MSDYSHIESTKLSLSRSLRRVDNIFGSTDRQRRIAKKVARQKVSGSSQQTVVALTVVL